MSESRSEFEAWFEEESGGRQNMADYRHWANAGWQASRRAALEEAANLCDAASAEHEASARLNWRSFSSDEGEGAAAKAASDIAVAIRSLAQTKGDSAMATKTQED